MGRAVLLLQRINAPLTRPTRPSREPRTQPEANPWGIAEHDYRMWRARNSLIYTPLAYITREEAIEFLHDTYWLSGQCHLLAWPIACATLACALHTGVPSAQRVLRRALLCTLMGPHLAEEAMLRCHQSGRFESPLSADELAAIREQPLIPFLHAVLDARRAWLAEIAARDASQAVPCERWLASIDALALVLGNGGDIGSLPVAENASGPGLMAALTAPA